jgi:TolA-binding protein
MRALSSNKSVLVLVASLALPSAVLAGPAEDQYAVAAGHYKQKRWKFAADEFQSFLADYPEHGSATKARFYLGEALIQLHHYDEAADRFRSFLEHAPQDPLAKKARFRTGEALYFARHFDQAKTELERFTRDVPDDSLNGYAFAYLGEMALRAGDPKQAQAWYAESLKRFPQGPLQDDCRFGLARALESHGQNEEARRLYLALAAKPQSAWSPKAQFRLGANFYAAGEYEEALTCFQEMIAEPRFAASPLRMQAALAAGESLYHLENLDAAEQQFTLLLDKQPIAAEARYWLGLTQAARKDWNTAAATLLAAAAEAKDDVKVAAAARFHAGDVLLQADKPSEAQAQYAIVLANWPQSEFAEKSLLGEMQVALATGDHKTIDDLAAQFAERFPTTSLKAQIERVMGRSLIERKDYVAAAALFEKLLAAPPAENRQADNDRCLLAASYLGQERFNDALQTVNAASVAKQPAADERQLWIDLNRQRAAALVGLEQFNDAAQVLEQLLAVKPDAKTSAWARAELAVCLAKSDQLERAKALYAELPAEAAGSELFSAATLALANAALDQDDAGWASELFEKLTSQASGFKGRAWWGLARSRVKQGDSSAAVSALDKLLADQPNDPLAPEAALARGQLWEQLKDDEAALRSYKLVIDSYATGPKLPQAMLAAARVEQRLKRPQNAAAFYERLDNQFPQLPEREVVLYEWAWALREAGNAEKADEVFERLHAQKPHGKFWPDAVYRLAERAYEKKDFARAEQLASELIGGASAGGASASQVLPHVLYLQAQIAAAQNQWSRVAAPLERLIAESSDNPIVPLAQYLIAEAAYREGQYDRAAELFRELAESIPGRTDTWVAMVPLRRAQILAQQKEWHDALQLASQIETDFPDFEQEYEVDYLIGRCQANLGRFDDARAAYRRVVKSAAGEKTETAAKAQWMIGESYFHQKNYEAALREYLRVEILYDYPTWQAAALFEAAKCHEHLGELKQAAELYEKLVKAYPDSPLAKDAAQRLKSNNARAEK